MLADNPMDTAKFRRVETPVVGRSDRCHPELRLSFVADDVDVRRLVAVGGVGEHFGMDHTAGRWAVGLPGSTRVSRKVGSRFWALV